MKAAGLPTKIEIVTLGANLPCATLLHMIKVGVRELRQNASVYLARVQQGEVVEVSVRGRTVARLVPALDSEWEQLVAAGQVRQIRETARVGSSVASLDEIEPLDLGVDLAGELLRAREDER